MSKLNATLVSVIPPPRANPVYSPYFAELKTFLSRCRLNFRSVLLDKEEDFNFFLFARSFLKKNFFCGIFALFNWK